MHILKTFFYQLIQINLTPTMKSFTHNPRAEICSVTTYYDGKDRRETTNRKCCPGLEI